MKKMVMKSLVIIILSGIVMSCGPDNETESIKKQISEYKTQVNDLNLKIKDLEKELENINKGESLYHIPVRILNMQKRPFNHYFEVSGSLEAVDKAYISPEINGQIKEISVNKGERVKKGQLLARLNTSITENTIEEVKTQLELATTLYEKQKQLWDKKIGSEVQFLQAKNNKEALESKLETLQAQLDMAYIRAPIDGIVDQINVEPGELAMPGMQLMQVVNLDEMYVQADVSEKYLPDIQKGDEVALRFPTFPSIDLRVKVHRIGNIINKGNRTFPVEFLIDNVNDMLKPNVLALITFQDYSEENAFVIPSIIIKEDLEGAYIYAVKENNGKQYARKIYITTGMTYKDETMVSSGLEVGDQVITEGYSLVTDGTEVKIN